jgi:hypothetical protein
MSGSANHWAQATPRWARVLFPSQRPGRPDPARWAIESVCVPTNC